MNRRQFFRTGAAGLGAAALGLAGQAGGSKPLRVGMIGCGWYGKSDLLRLIQVAPVEVVSLCDVDRRMLAEAAEVVSVRQASHKKPRTFGDYRTMLAE
jgi:predicted dehydrogenase